MKRCLLLLAVLAAASSLYAQDSQKYTQEEVLAVFAQYNPAVLEKAKTNEQYNDILQKLAASYQKDKTADSQTELIALAKNFDNSLRLFIIAKTYENGLALQQASNIDLAALETTTQDDLLAVFEDIYENTLAIHEEEIKLCKARIKALKKDKSLTKEDRKAQIAKENDRIKALKTEIKQLKKDSKEKVRSASELYFADLKDEVSSKTVSVTKAAQEEAQKAKSTKNLQVKTKNKKPVGK